MIYSEKREYKQLSGKMHFRQGKLKKNRGKKSTPEIKELNLLQQNTLPSEKAFPAISPSTL